MNQEQKGIPKNIKRARNNIFDLQGLSSRRKPASYDDTGSGSSTHGFPIGLSPHEVSGDTFENEASGKPLPLKARTKSSVKGTMSVQGVISSETRNLKEGGQKGLKISPFGRNNPSEGREDKNDFLGKRPASLLAAGERYLRRRGLLAPRREAEALLQFMLSCRIIDLYIDRNRIVSEAEQSTFFQLLQRRGRREPLQYLLGEVTFCGLSFLIKPGVFIPRPETEQIVTVASALVPFPPKILDLCTGSGALAIALAKQIPHAEVTAIDCSDVALDVAQLNQERHATQIRFLKGDLFGPLQPEDGFDLIVSNPPYIAKNDQIKLDPEVTQYEPPRALFSSEDGFAHLIRILREATTFLVYGGNLILEIGAGQSPRLLDFIERETPFVPTVYPDETGIPRVIRCRWIK